MIKFNLMFTILSVIIFLFRYLFRSNLLQCQIAVNSYSTDGSSGFTVGVFWIKITPVSF